VEQSGGGERDRRADHHQHPRRVARSWVMLMTWCGPCRVNLVLVHGTRLGGGSAGACAADGIPVNPGVAAL
jgi:hypothetical protein